MDVENPAGPFQTCGSCRRVWQAWESFILDPEVRLLGLQSEAAFPDANLLVFEDRCGGSVSILCRRLRHILPEPEAATPHPRLLGTSECRGHCLRLDDLEPCDAACSNARDRQLILLIQRLKSGAESQPCRD